MASIESMLGKAMMVTAANAPTRCAPSLNRPDNRISGCNIRPSRFERSHAAPRANFLSQKFDHREAIGAPIQYRDYVAHVPVIGKNRCGKRAKSGEGNSRLQMNHFRDRVSA